MRRNSQPQQRDLWLEHWRDEVDAAFLYRRIAAAETDAKRAKVFGDLAQVEDHHVVRWEQVLRGAGAAVPPLRPSLRARIIALIGRLLGWRLLASILLAEEGRETKGYLRGALHYDDPNASRTAAELALIYQTRGMGSDAARRAAKEVMANPEHALQEKTQLELGIGEASMSPLREGWITGLATAVGAFIPVFPFIVLRGMPAIMLSFAISMLSHFGVGAARSVFTGRGAFRSGLDMFVVGLGIAVIGYLVGEWIARTL